ncbi:MULTISPECIES: cytochrome c biogenesis protein ResB [unclassified Nocardioides]|uniref:cytochrome c biogenesis protein ResB n=1 Tax=unclassified Nocardioides TaxID=2615069 RepID=UPI0009F10703|nr:MULTISPECIES: cytochrome c biogenesis protein ResB [unclassified Nocardioides]GAW48850.1 ResB family protein [Nocardioides sp. PD653-B2]GAW54487.1 ResB family protein [Nocardioides sp. PD653]
MSTTLSTRPPEDDRRPGELTFGEFLRWVWRQVTSMRTALILLLLLALAAVPGSIIPQSGVDALKTSNWQADHPKLTPVYERLGLFSVYDSVWFSAIYILLMLSLVGCIVPRTFVYLRGIRAKPPVTPRNLTRLPDHASYQTSDDLDVVLERARLALRKRRYRMTLEDDAVSAERGYLREVGNLVFHLSVLIVLVGFAMGGLFGYKGGVILVTGNGFSNNLTQYDDFDPGSLFSADDLEPFSFTVNDFTADWLTEGPRAGMARAFNAQLSYQESPDSPSKDYDLRVNHPLTIGNTEVFLIGHGYAPIITIRDGDGDKVYSGPTVFLPTDQTFQSIGVVKAPNADPTQIGLEGEFYPTVAFSKHTGSYFSAFGNAVDPLVSMLVYTGDLGMDTGAPQSVYSLDKTGTAMLTKKNGAPYRIDLRPGDTVTLPNGLGTVSFDGLDTWTKIQISQTPGKWIALTGVVLALLGLLGSLFIRPRRVWVRARREGDGTLVEVAALDRSGGGDVAVVVDELVRALQGPPQPEPEDKS